MAGILEGRRAYVTGGSSGIGAAIVEAFVKQGADVAIGAATHATEAEETAARLRGGGGWGVGGAHTRHGGGETGGAVKRRRPPHRGRAADLSKRAEAERAGDEVLRALGGLDIFVHSAGIDITKSAPAHETPEDTWD